MKKYSLTELAEVLVERYDIDTEGYPDLDEFQEDGLGNFRKQIVRTLKRVSVGNKTLYESIYDPDSRKRMISFEDYFQYCFPMWAQYLRTDRKSVV